MYCWIRIRFYVGWAQNKQCFPFGCFECLDNGVFLWPRDVVNRIQKESINYEVAICFATNPMISDLSFGHLKCPIWTYFLSRALQFEETVASTWWLVSKQVQLRSKIVSLCQEWRRAGAYGRFPSHKVQTRLLLGCVGNYGSHCGWRLCRFITRSFGSQFFSITARGSGLGNRKFSGGFSFKMRLDRNNNSDIGQLKARQGLGNCLVKNCTFTCSCILMLTSSITIIEVRFFCSGMVGNMKVLLRIVTFLLDLNDDGPRFFLE